MPPAIPQSALRAPLNGILGSEANVRLLRVLALGDGSIAAGELSRRAGLSRTNVYPVLKALEGTGIVEFLGAGSGRQVAYRRAHPLAGAIASLFRAEADRVDSLVAELRRVFDSVQPPPASAWLEGTMLKGTDRPDDAITCVIVGDPSSLPRVIDSLSRPLAKIERKLEVHIEVQGIARSELATRARAGEALDDVILLAGAPPAALVPSTRPASRVSSRSHAHHDDAARRLAAAVAEKLAREPGLVALAKRRLARRLAAASPQERRELLEWDRILEAMSPSRLRRFLVEPGERATRLRQTLPLVDLLTAAERRAVLASASDAEARAVVGVTRRASRT